MPDGTYQGDDLRRLGKPSALERRFGDEGPRALINETERLSDLIDTVSKKLAEIERTTSLIFSLLEFPLPACDALNTPLMKSVVVTAKMALAASDGFYQLEYDRNGHAFRWTGPQAEFRFIVFLDRSQPCRGSLTLVANGQFNDAAEMACFVDRASVPTVLRPGGDGRLVTVDFEAPRLEVARATELVFAAPRLVAPGGGDPRTLGVGFVELRLGGAPAEADS